MTREGQGRGPEDAQRPLASTRWSGPDAGADDELLPPFVPGRSRQTPAEPEVVEPASEAQVTDHEEAVADTGESVTTGDEAVKEEEAFPFDSPGGWDESFPFDPGEVETEPAFADLPGGEGEPFDMSGFEEPPQENAFQADTRQAEPWSEDAWAPEGDESESVEADQGVSGAAEDMAARLEDLAARIRSEGADGARAGMLSDDRITALLSTLIAGYLGGREG
jgi:hypothetical protein